MKTMLAAYLPGNSTVDLREVAVPTPGINQVLIKMKSSGICGSDVHYIYHQHRATAAAPDKPLYQGFINGHEPCGQIVAMGQGCRHFKEGDRVLVYHISGCGFCPNCRRGFPISCTGKGKAAYGWQRDGGHAEYLLAEEKDLILLPDALSYEDGAFISCGVGISTQLSPIVARVFISHPPAAARESVPAPGGHRVWARSYTSSPAPPYSNPHSPGR